MQELNPYFNLISDLRGAVRLSGGTFDFETKRERLDEVNGELQEPNVWNDPERAQALGKERAQLEAVVNRLASLDRGLNEVAELLLLAGEEGDEAAVTEVVRDLERYAGVVADLEFQRMFSGELDASNAFLDIQAGSGGTEAQDWAEMLLRMYLRWGERRGFKTELLEVSPGEVAGIKSASISFEGSYAYGWLRTETGVHRLVRKSPFDSGNRRHTSFAAVFVSPEVDDTSKWTSIRLICGSMCFALPGPVASTSTAPNRRFVSLICRPILWCNARTTVPNTRTAPPR
jgi:peptide chain release factor 2